MKPDRYTYISKNLTCQVRYCNFHITITSTEESMNQCKDLMLEKAIDEIQTRNQ